VLFVLQFKGASAAANLQLLAILTFFFNVGSAAQFLSKRVMPNFFPWVGENVAEAFEVALAWVNLAVWSHASVNHGGGAAFNP
jgi:hypothetical protein